MHPETTIDAEFSRVVGILRQLRAPGGCPWDRKQTIESIRPHTLEETYEVLEAISDRNWPGLREELGDLLLQVLFYAEIASEEGYFDLHGVLTELAAKLVRRHPHVFAEQATEGMSAEQALARWNAAKRAEGKAGERAGSVMAGVARGLPALAEAHKLGQRAAGVGFDWTSVAGVMDKLDEEMDELRAELQRTPAETGRVEEELGDVLLTLASLARQLGLEPETALKRANRKFQQRFERMEELAGGGDVARQTAEQWEALWRQAKA
ncbi:MAG: nucleoside triphosphate pyrophosphohydrolase [Terriglobales bacterium]